MYLTHDFILSFNIMPPFPSYWISESFHFNAKPTRGQAVLPSKLVAWPRSSVLQTGRREVPTLIPGLACRLSCLQFSVVFSETSINKGYDPYERLLLLRRAIPFKSQIPRVTTEPTANESTKIGGL